MNGLSPHNKPPLTTTEGCVPFREEKKAASVKDSNQYLLLPGIATRLS